jgi:hypothetical protein
MFRQMDSESNTQASGEAGLRSPWGERWSRVAALVPTFSAVTVVVVALAATVMVTREDWQEANRPQVMSKAEQDVVKAPPLVVKAPPVKPSPGAAGQAQRRTAEAPMSWNALGAGPACRNCGVVESVAPVSHQGAFQMRIRMDDGTLRTVEQRGAVAAGSRVLLERGSLRVMSAATRQG